MSVTISTLTSIGRFLGLTKDGVPQSFDKFIYSICYRLEGRLDFEPNDVLLGWMANRGTILDLMINNAALFDSLRYEDIWMAKKSLKWNLSDKSSKISSFTPCFVQLPLNDELRCVNRLLLTTDDAPAMTRIHRVMSVVLTYFNGLYTIEKAYNQYNHDYSTLIFKTFGDVVTTVVSIVPHSMWGSDDASARVIVSLYLAHQSNSSQKKHIPKVYGVVTTGTDWQWWSYDGSKFRVHHHVDSMTFEQIRDIELHKKTTGRLAGALINGWFGSTKYFLDEDRKQEAALNKKLRRLKPGDPDADTIFDQFKDLTYQSKRKFVREGKKPITKVL